ncbi:MAG: cytochrome c [Planctomycetes bacterium]|nr:cytochrome c [Planctomycetota bacterium]
MSSRGFFASLLLAGSSCIVAGCSEPPGPTGTNPEELYLHHCAKCHARAGEPGGPNLGGSKGPDLSHIGSATGMTVDWLTEYISNPQSKRPDVRVMPAFNTKMTPEQIKALAEWLAAKK